MKTKLFFLMAILCFLVGSAQENSPQANILFNAFKQSNVNGGGNCASIALIKASIGTFGYGKVFISIKDDKNKTLSVKLRDNSTYLLTYNEIDEATKENGFKIKSQQAEAQNIKFYADTCFAVMVKVQQKIMDYDSYEKALFSLLNGYYTPNINHLLGVKFKEVSLRNLKTSTNVVFYNSYHAVYSSYGYYDETKSSSGYSLNSNFKKNRFGPKCSWYLCKPRKVFVVE